jgi:hypothetical protein
MKTRFIYLFIYLLLSNIGHVNAQNNDFDKQANKALTDFYFAYSNLKHTVAGRYKIDSLFNKYCTKKFKQLIYKEFKANGFDHDLLTNDNGIDSTALKTFNVIKNVTLNSVYSISYQQKIINAFNNPELVKVKFKVMVVREDGSLKIASVF